MRRRPSFVPLALLALLALLAGCDCAGDTGPGDAGDAGGGDTSFDGGPRPDGGGMRCGNSMVEGTEECDDGNDAADDGCFMCELECGDGRVGGEELCDTAIAAGTTGACPTSCDDGVACTTDNIDGSECQVSCVHGDITIPADDDTCCPPGANASTDNDCPGTCGDGLRTGTEACDTAIAAGSVGSCPTSCDDGMACTTDALMGAGTCDAACSATPITAPTNGDGCCPSGATIGTDDDCAAACGDGVLSMGETCDTAITSGAGACPTSCNDGVACTTDMLMGAGTCNAICGFAPITTPMGGDGCCPAGATMATDSDCMGVCGDGIVQSGESCDTAITSGAGRCPTSCNDGMACTADMLNGAGTCAASCTATPITMPRNGDGCCPPGATIGTDNDCPARCGDAVVSAGETCDTAIASGMGACPTTCSDGMVCTRDTLTNMGTCTAACMFAPITMPMNGDGCCPTGATIGTDNDCPARCGDRVVTAPETCDDGNMTSGDGCSSTCMMEMSMLSAFRLDSLSLRDPHAFASILIFCSDITNTLNTELSDAITMDGDMPADGLLDLSIAQIFNPLVQAAGSSTATYLSFPDCTTPMSSTMCTLPMGGTRAGMSTAANQGGTSVCLAPVMGTVRPYSPAVVSPTAGGGATCYSANAGSVTFTLAGIPITLTDAQIGGEWVGTPATSIRDGLIRGFLSEADANATVLPATLPVVGGMRLSSILRGGMGNCQGGSDMDMGPGGVRGWYMYLNFTARLVPYSEL